MSAIDAKSSTKKWNWGIVGTGNIASKFADDLEYVSGAKKSAVYSRSQATAEAFADKHEIARCYVDLEEFAHSPEIDIIYIATPHTAHVEQAVVALNAGKAVLIEKPIAMCAADVAVLQKTATTKGTFLMEAMWSRFLPAVQRAKAHLESGMMGKVERAEVSLYYNREFDPNDRLFDPQLGGGVLHDLGVYPISLATYLFGPPRLTACEWFAAPNGVNMRSSLEIVCSGVPVHIEVGFGDERDNTFDIFGEKGALRIERHFLRSEKLTIWNGYQRALPTPTGSFGIKLRNRLGLHGGKTERFELVGTGLHFQASAVQAALGQGLKEHSVMPLEQSAQVLSIIEQVLEKPPTP